MSNVRITTMFFFQLSILLFSIYSEFLAAGAAPLGRDAIVKRIEHSGRGTWFEVGLGNCGEYNVDSDKIVAISKTLYDDNNGGNCEQWVEIVNTGNGNVAYGKTRDSCPSCAYSDLDMSPSLFEELNSDLGVGVLSIEWHFMSKGWSP